MYRSNCGVIIAPDPFPAFLWQVAKPFSQPFYKPKLNGLGLQFKDCSVFTYIHMIYGRGNNFLIEGEATIFWPLERADSLEKILMLGKIEGRRTGQQRMRWLDDIINSMKMSLSKLQEIVKDSETWYTAVYGVSKSRTWLSDWIPTNNFHYLNFNLEKRNLCLFLLSSAFILCLLYKTITVINKCSKFSKPTSKISVSGLVSNIHLPPVILCII